MFLSASYRRAVCGCLALGVVLAVPAVGMAEGSWETTPESEVAVRRGLAWLAANQTAEGNWESNDLGLVSMGALAFLAAGHTPGIGKYGQNMQRALDYVVSHAKPSGLLNIADGQRDMYNHGLSTFVLGQAYGMTADTRVSNVLDRALKLIANTQCNDGGWDYRARPQANGHDLSLAVMQAKALRSAVDSGLEVSPDVIELAIRSVREHYHPKHGKRNNGEATLREGPGQFTYSRGGGQGSIAMAAAGVVCLQEFGQYDDWRIAKNMEVIVASLKQQHPGSRNGQVPWDAYTLYYVGQALYQVGGQTWRESYPRLRDHLVAVQVRDEEHPNNDGKWQSGAHIGGKPGDLYGTSVAVFVLSMPNRYLPILQEGHIDSLQRQFTEKEIHSE